MVPKNMKANEIISEANKQKKIEIISASTISTLHKQCGEFLNNATRPLYRGFKRDITGLAKVPIRTNRQPADSSHIDTTAFNYLFELNTGVPNIRNRTAFASVVAETAMAYGTSGMIFPLNGTKFYRATGIDDVYGEFEASIDDFDSIIYDYAAKIGKSDEEENTIYDELSDISEVFWHRTDKLNVAKIKKAFGKHLPVWHKFVKQFQPIINKFYMYDGFHPELNKASEEIAMFGKPYYFALDIESIIDMMYYAQEDDKSVLYIGDKPFTRVEITGYMIASDIIFRAIKNKQKIYSVSRD
jgi:hypothetical protein